MKLSELIGETTEYDKKAMLEERKPKSWLKSVSAFANGIGGALFFGVSDDEVLVGLEDAKGVSEKISEAIKTKMDPTPQVVLEIYAEDGKEFVILRVPSGQETPYYYTGDGSRIAFVRIGNESVPASAVDLKRLVLRGSNASYDSLSSRYSFDSLAFTKLRSVYRMRTGTELTDSDFVSFELVDENNKLTNAGVLLADDSPIRQSRLFCTRWYGLDKASGIMDALDDKEYSGSLVSLLQNGTEFVKNNTKKRWKKVGNGRVEMPEYPEQAVHEVIVNALIHRDYMEIGSEVHIDIFDDRMEVYSPGGMFDGSIVQNLDTDHVASKRRNPVIADIFSRMHFMERRGSGFKKIKADYRHAVSYRPELEPVFQSTPTSFFATLYNLNYNVAIEKVLIDSEKVSVGEENVSIDFAKRFVEATIDSLHANKNTKDNAKKLFAHTSFDNVFGRNDMMEILSLSITAAGNLIKKLKEAGLIEPVSGQGKGKYKFIEPNE
jgi:predicted HTH transcriptional regulator